MYSSSILGPSNSLFDRQFRLVYRVIFYDVLILVSDLAYMGGA